MQNRNAVFQFEFRKAVNDTLMTYKGTNAQKMQNIKNLNYFSAVQKGLYVSPH